MNIAKVILVFLIICMQAQSFHIRRIGTVDGLSNNNVVSIDQDREGFMWFATKNGLNRFDGNRFMVFRYSENDPNTLSNDILNYVFADKNEDIVWVATEKHGLNEYNYKTLQFIRHTHNSSDPYSLSGNGVTHITGAKSGNLWIATYNAGINYFDKSTRQFIRYNTGNIDGLASNFNWYIFPDGDKLYVGHVQDGLSIINLQTKKATNLRHIPGNPNSLPDNTVTCIFKDSKNYIWIGTRSGLSRYNPETKQFINFFNIPEKQNSLTANFIKSIVETQTGELWIGTEGGGINILNLESLEANTDPTQIQFRHIVESITPNGLSNSSVQALIQDSFGNFWSGGFIGGLNFIQIQKKFFSKITYLPYIGNINSLPYNTAMGLSSDKNDNVWVANGAGGMSKYHFHNKIKTINRAPELADSLFVFTASIDENNNMWFGTSDGKVFFYDTNRKRFTQLTSYPYINVPVYHILIDGNEKLWICSDIGLYVYDLKDKTGIEYTTANSDLPDNNLRYVLKDSHGNYWIGALGGGLQVYDSQFRLLHDYGQHFNFYSINHIYMDSAHRVWVGSQNDLFLFPDYETSNVVRIGKNQGLKENYIMAITEGKTADDIWVSTINGISYLNLKTGVFRNYDLSDDIAMGDYYKTAVAKTSDGTIFFGSQHGISFFNQIPVERPKISIQPVISSFQITERTRRITSGLVDFPISDVVELKYNQNTFQIHFNVPDFSLSNITEFAYQLLGLDNSWYFINKDKQVIFRNLRPGNYVFNVRSRLQNGDWSDHITALKIVIHPPFWLSWPAKLAYLVVVLLIILALVRFYKKRLVIENSLILETRKHQQEQHLNEERLRFYTNLAHELRTPMTLIIGSLEDIVSDKTVQPALAMKLNSVHRVANRLLNIINQLLEFRKSETKNRELAVKKGNILTLIYEIALRYKELHQKKEVQLNLSLPEHPVDIYYDADVITIILDNLISNAYKFTTEGEIRIDLREKYDTNIKYVEISVSDTGIGIPKKEIPLIFNRYYQAKNKSLNTGTGIGLALVKNMVDLHEAEISVSSELNKGTTFVIKILANNSYPNAIHLTEFSDPTETHTADETYARQLILVVDDNPEILEYVCDSLADSYDVITAENGKMGYEMACQRIPDAVISDVMMPEVDGFELCKSLKSNVLTSHVPVILLTAKTTLHDKTEGYDAGADSYITKPFSGSLLRSRIKNLLQTRSKLNNAYNLFLNKKSILNESASELDKEFIEKVTLFIEKNAEDEALNVGMIAKKMNMSHSSLYRKIKALTDLTANEFIKKVRMQLAEQMLITGRYTINEVMYRIGMNNPGYFRQCFKDEFGLNPSDYIQKLKK